MRSAAREPSLVLSQNLYRYEDCGMKCWTIVFILLTSTCQSSFAHVHRIRPRRTTDPSYAAALAAANHFLTAWQAEDHETGIVMLTDSAREHATAEQLQEFFSPGPQAAYEISRGKRLNTARYEFPVVLFGASSTANHARTCTIVVRRGGRNEWAVDKLP